MAQTGPEQPPEQPVGEGFRAAMDALTERRYREMRGAWPERPSDCAAPKPHAAPATRWPAASPNTRPAAGLRAHHRPPGTP
ncbi:hypothetical protein I552_0444 [Mycobacterium xenopi 3993]|nr:hypothetical protein I552_0444 [Mycobacterium xenopi 3993]